MTRENDSADALPAPFPDPSGRLPDPVLSNVSLALFLLRRVWAKPDMMKRIQAQTSTGPGGRPLQLSNLMVVHAVAALSGTPGDAVPAPAPAPADGPTANGKPGASCASPEVTVGAVAERLEIDPSTASRLVGHAIDAGLVSRRPSPVDARRANLGLTEGGVRVKQVADRFRRAYLDELMTGWTPAERADFARLLTRFADAAVRAPADPVGVDKIVEEARADRSGQAG